MKRLALTLLALTLSTQAALCQSLVLPIGKNAANQQSPANPQCNELDINGLTYSATNPIPAQLSQGNSAVSVTNPLNVNIGNGSAALAGTAATTAAALPVSLGAGSVNTYMATTAYAAPVATPTDILGIVGSASKTVKILKITIDGTQTTAGINKFFLIKRSTADTGSTPSASTLVPVDSANPAATAVIQLYTTTNPTTGTPVGTAYSASLLTPLPASVGGSGDQVLFDAKITGEPITLRGVAQELDVNFAGAAVPNGMTLAFNVLFTEE